MSSTAKPVTAWEVIDHGIEHEQYFVGCGIAFTEYADVATGIGDNAQEALDDALESLAQCGYEISDDDAELMAEELEDTDSSVSELVSDSANTHEDYDSHHYYVSVRIK